MLFHPPHFPFLLVIDFDIAGRVIRRCFVLGESRDLGFDMG